MMNRVLLAGGVALMVLVAACARHAQPVPAPMPAVALTVPPAAAPAVTTKAVYVPDTTHSGQPLPDGVLGWDAMLKTQDVKSTENYVHFVFNFTNLTTGYVSILNVQPSCGCTTAELPPTPWTLPAGASGQIKLKVNIANKVGKLFKGATVTTDKGTKSLTMIINVSAPAPVQMTETDLENGIAAAKVDRQAVFHGDCASCHDRDLNGKYGQNLYGAACTICHEGTHRASMVPDLHHLTVPTNVEFWRTWITGGKPGSLMPAFADSQGGPLTDIQISSLAQYLNAVYPSTVPLPAAGKN